MVTQPGLGLRLPDPAINELTLQRGKEAFGPSVVTGIANGAHAGPDTHFFAALAKRHRRAGCPGLSGESPTPACA